MLCSIIIFITISINLILSYCEGGYFPLGMESLSLRTIDAFPYNAQNLTMGLPEFAYYPKNRW